MIKGFIILIIAIFVLALTIFIVISGYGLYRINRGFLKDKHVVKMFEKYGFKYTLKSNYELYDEFNESKVPKLLYFAFNQYESGVIFSKEYGNTVCSHIYSQNIIDCESTIFDVNNTLSLYIAKYLDTNRYFVNVYNSESRQNLYCEVDKDINLNGTDCEVVLFSEKETIAKVIENFKVYEEEITGILNELE